MNFNPFSTYSIKIPLFVFISLLYSPLNHAEFELDTHDETDAVIDDSALKANSTLQSLKNLDKHQQYQAPFVQDLSNNQKVRTLFVSATDLPIVKD